MKQKYYVTTAIAYVNGKPHIGHALEFLQADFVARYHRLAGKDVHFLTGTDEHGQKIVETAKQQGMSTDKLVEQNAKIFIEFTKLLNLSNDDFIRTSDEKKHWPSVIKLWNTLKDKGDIYKKQYEGLYCVGCEKFMTKKEVDAVGNCSVHEKPPKPIKEENYFFKLSKYSDKVKELIEKDKYKVTPKTRKNEILSFLSSKVEDISFSRSKKALPWGVPVPGDEDQVMYVWCDALTNYISALDFANNGKLYKKFWPADAHIIGKDILRFHAAYWPAMLLSAKVKLPKNLFVHGFITVNGQKMSKSLGNVVDPYEQIEKFGLEAVRLYLLKEIIDSDDGDYSEERLVEMINNELADDLGNLVRRVTVLVEKNFNGKIPKQGKLEKADKEFIQKSKFAKEFEQLIISFKFNKAIGLLWEFIRATNKYLTETEPWKIKDKARLGTVLYNALESTRIIALYLNPVMPSTADKILELIGQKIVSFDKAKFTSKTTGKIKLGEVLFKKVKIEDSAVDPFAKLDLRVAKIVKVDNHPNADKLYVLQIDFGSEKKQIVSGLVDNYKAKELLGKKIIAIFNLKPAKLRGVESNGMLLAAEDKKKVVVLEAEKAELGSKVFVDSVASKPDKVISVDDFFNAKMVAKKGKAYYNGEKLRVESGRVTVEGVEEETNIC